MSNFEKNYEIDESSGQHIIDERGNTYLMLAKYKWFGKGDYKLGIRTFYSTANGETIGKGISFLTDDGPHELTRVMIQEGYGRLREIVETLKDHRPEVVGALMNDFNDMTADEKAAFDYAYTNHNEFSDDEKDMFDPEDLLED